MSNNYKNKAASALVLFTQCAVMPAYVLLLLYVPKYSTLVSDHAAVAFAVLLSLLAFQATLHLARRQQFATGVFATSIACSLSAIAFLSCGYLLFSSYWSELVAPLFVLAVIGAPMTFASYALTRNASTASELWSVLRVRTLVCELGFLVSLSAFKAIQEEVFGEHTLQLFFLAAAALYALACVVHIYAVTRASTESELNLDLTPTGASTGLRVYLRAAVQQTLAGVIAFAALESTGTASVWLLAAIACTITIVSVTWKTGFQSATKPCATVGALVVGVSCAVQLTVPGVTPLPVLGACYVLLKVGSDWATAESCASARHCGPTEFEWFKLTFGSDLFPVLVYLAHSNVSNSFFPVSLLCLSIVCLASQ